MLAPSANRVTPRLAMATNQSTNAITNSWNSPRIGDNPMIQHFRPPIGSVISDHQKAGILTRCKAVQLVVGFVLLALCTRQLQCMIQMLLVGLSALEWRTWRGRSRMTTLPSWI